MAAEPSGRFITAREHPVLLQLATRLTDRELILASRQAGELRLPLRDHAGEGTRASIWGDEVGVCDEGAAAAAFMTRHLGVEARLLFMPITARRPVDPQYAGPDDRVSFADGFPLLLIGRASLDDLNARLENPIPMSRFRPNIVVGGSSAYAEDSWSRIRVGTVACDVVKPCARCVVTTLDPATLEASREPLRTLASYRGGNGKVWFGQNVIHRSAGSLRVGDPLTVVGAASRDPGGVRIP